MALNHLPTPQVPVLNLWLSLHCKIWEHVCQHCASKDLIGVEHKMKEKQQSNQAKTVLTVQWRFNLNFIAVYSCLNPSSSINICVTYVFTLNHKGLLIHGYKKSHPVEGVMMQPPRSTVILQPQPRSGVSWFIPKLCPSSCAKVTAAPSGFSEWSCDREKKENPRTSEHINNV